MFRGCPKKCDINPAIVKFGTFFRTSDSKYIQRWKCKNCESTFSAATENPCFGQNKRRLNPVVWRYFFTKSSQRRIAKLLKINRKTVARKYKFLGLKGRQSRLMYLERYKINQAVAVQFDDLVTFEHTKCKPVAIGLLVEEKTRKILDYEVSPMAANGLLAEISRKKYGKRKDGRQRAWKKLFARSKKVVSEDAVFKSDEHPLYPNLVKTYFPKAKHLRYKGRRGCVVGQGELKAGGFDPIFNLNHNCGMLRDSISQLVRRTWCTTKKIESLRILLDIYIDGHNRILTDG